MGAFSIQGFAQGCEQVMEAADDKEGAAKAYLQGALEAHEADDIVAALEAAIPAGASIGEMIVYNSSKLTMLFARIPGKFRSGIHNHTVFACMGQLTGEERSVIYERTDDQRGLAITGTTEVTAGQAISLPADVIHHIENPMSEPSCSLHIYGGDFGALMDQRSLWSSDKHDELSFSFEGLVQQSVLSMKQDGNTEGLQALADAIPAVHALLAAE